MSLGSVTVNNLDLAQGTPSEVECLDLFVGYVPTAPETNQVHAINMSTDLDVLLGAGASNVKTQIEAARSNGGQNWFAYVLPLLSEADPMAEVDKAVGNFSVESVVVCDPVANKADLENMQSTAMELIGKYQRRVFFQSAFRSPGAEESWSDYSAEAKAITENVAADRVVIVPLLYPDFLGALAGRLANQSVSVADSPMRVATGTLLGNYAERPTDANGLELDKSVLLDLHNNGRLTVPTWYEDYDGTYTSDGFTLAPETSDYRVIENLRVADKAARRIYLLAVARIGNRLLNSTPQSIAFNSTYFMKPLREMSHGVEINGTPFPGEIEPPKAGDIVISWPTKYAVEIYFTLRPLNCPKEITANITLDLNNYAEAA
ncbi:DUF2586 domain-containing protein [Endozoicomonas sp. ONNA2]|uniref:DUF2586 domain-containing protein n=1 Tax=Endozoicomonas sp. ONNA2 TaxID=2828741 RepID=UPI002149609C|nr:DUF2586 domain-containing protein [Endozoicomonas sp. ONNA2]